MIKIDFSTPILEDGSKIYELVKRSFPLDLNSQYAYMLICTHFSNTSIVAKVDNQVVGFVSAYLLPKSPQTLFIWQVAVDKSMRNQGLAKRLLKEILQNLPNIKWIETTISPSNKASLKLFKSIALELNVSIQKSPFFDAALFQNEEHESEELYRIGSLC
jgi:L-2,4-diaminobutyric acid acetyltransferase